MLLIATPSARDVARQFQITDDELLVLCSSRPHGVRTWVSREDVVEYIIRKALPIDHLSITFEYATAVPTRRARWYYGDDRQYMCLRHVYETCKPYALRPYQDAAMRSCFGSDEGRPFMQSNLTEAYCAAGKTYIGSALVLSLQMPTVIITSHCVSVQQWYMHFASMGIAPEHMFVLGDHACVPNHIPPITITTYTMFAAIFNRTNSTHYGLCQNLRIYDSFLILDEVHTASATTYEEAVFSQRSKCIIGLTATLCREDDGVGKLFTNVGPVGFTIHANMLVDEGFIAGMNHIKVLIPLSPHARTSYDDSANAMVKQGISIVNPYKIGVLIGILRKHSDKHILVFCDVLVCMDILVDTVRAQGIRAIGPVTGNTSREDRLVYFKHFEKATTACLFLSKVGDNALDLKCANVIIKLSTVSRSRNQEEQRNGRGARKHSLADTVLYSLVSKNTQEDVFFERRDRYLMGRGFELEYIDIDTDAAKMQIGEWKVDNRGVVDACVRALANKAEANKAEANKPSVAEKRKRANGQGAKSQSALGR